MLKLQSVELKNETTVAYKGRAWNFVYKTF